MSDTNNPNPGQINDPTGNNAAGYYNPLKKPYRVLSDYQEFINRTNGILSIQIEDALHNLLTLTPTLHAENLLLAGEDVIWLRRLTSGPKCPNWIDESDQCSVSKCQECFGTGYYQGFDNAVLLKMSFIPGRADILVEQAGLTISQRPMAWTITTDPNIESRDMIITFQNERYLVHTAENADKQGRNMYQNLTLSRVDKTDVLYYVPVPSFIGDAIIDFNACLTINAPGKFNIPATIFIKNYIFNNPEFNITT